MTLKKKNVEWSGTHLKIMSTRSWYRKTHLKKIDGEWKCLRTKMYVTRQYLNEDKNESKNYTQNSIILGETEVRQPGHSTFIF